MTDSNCGAFYFDNGGVCSLLEPTNLYKNERDTSTIDTYMVTTYAGITKFSIYYFKVICLHKVYLVAYKILFRPIGGCQMESMELVEPL